MMASKGIIPCILLLLSSIPSNGFLFFGPSTSSPNWDVLIFVQNWPESVCDKYMNQRGGNSCNRYPKDHWTVHGIWPTRGRMGPFNCDSRKFDLAEIGNMERDLDEWWTPIQLNSRKTYFWEHEWEKHGTCAGPVIESQYQYFKQALDWVREYEMGQVLRTSGIVPGGEYSYQEIQEAIRRVLKKRAQVICYDGNGGSALLEVRMCFDPSLLLTDCNDYSNCQRGGTIRYPEAR